MLTNYPLIRCLAIYREMPWRFSLTAFLFITANLALGLQQYLIGRAINDVSSGNAVVRTLDGLDASTAWFWLWALLALALGRGVVQYLCGILSITLSQELLTRLRDRILHQVQTLDLGYHHSHGMGEMVTRTTRDADKVRDALISFWRQVVETPLVVLAAVGLLFWYHPLLAVVPLVLTALGLWIFVRQTGDLVVLDRAVGAAYDAVNQDLSEGIAGVRVIKSFALEQSRIERFDQQVNFFAEKAREALAFAASHIPLPQAVVALGHVWVLVFGAHLVANHQIGVGELVASLLVVTSLVFRIEGIGRVMQTFADARSSAARIWQLLDAKPAFSGGDQVLPKTALGLRLDQVEVASQQKAILQSISFTLKPGEIVALVGATGSGKSLLASLLPRLSAASNGHIYLGSHESGWQAIESMDLDGLRRRVHVVPQESLLFSESLAANLRRAKPDATDAELIHALQLAAADDVLSRLSQGLNTHLGDKGVTLSGGQRQRINLARALLAAPAILCLDDATSALDALSETRVLNNLRSLKGTTVLVISSKLSTILLADRVLLLDAGRIADSGTHAELSLRNSLYRDLLGVEHG